MPRNLGNLWVLSVLGIAIGGILSMTKLFKKEIREEFGAFVQKLQLLPPPQPAPPMRPHPLTGLTFAVSDIFDIEGYMTAFGHPDWARTHDVASGTCPVVSTLVEGGATCIGKTVLDELAYSISGENKHYVTPTNPAVPARIPGGSSSGAAVAVAANLVDFSLGVDTVGGVRVPAAFCGVIGFRPSYGAISRVRILPVSESLDTVGWFSRDPNVLRRVGHVLLQLPIAAQSSPRQFIMADDCFSLMKIPVDRIAQVVIKSTEKVFGRQLLRHENLSNYLTSKVPSLKECQSKETNGEVKTSSIRMLGNVLWYLHMHEFEHNHGEWINKEKPILEPAILAQIHEVPAASDAVIAIHKSIRNELRSTINTLLKHDGILVIPTTAYLPPKLGAKEILSGDYQNSAFSLLSIASLSGCCQVAVPLGYHDKCPVSVSFIARHGADGFLLDTMQSMYASLQLQADIISKSKISSSNVSQGQSSVIAKEKGNQTCEDEQLQEVIDFFTEAIQTENSATNCFDGDQAINYHGRAVAYFKLGSFLQAEEDCTRAINLDGENVEAYLWRGRAREKLGNYKGSIEDYSHASALAATNKRASAAVDRARKLIQQVSKEVDSAVIEVSASFQS